jgi:2-deoxy-D-gluconate 3-dehydrogenase
MDTMGARETGAGLQAFDLHGKVALVTGGNGGIGLGMALGLAQAGARVVIAARDAGKSEAAVQALRATGSDSFALAADVAHEESVTSMVEALVARCGRLDILVNNAGTTVRKTVDRLALDEWHQVIDTNLTGVFLCCRAAYPHFRSAGAGKIINIGSMMSIFGSANAPAYGASKGGLVQLTRSMAVAWGADRIQVNAVLPGWIETDLTEAARLAPTGLDERVVARTAAGRWGQPDDLAGIAMFLASRASDFVTGTAIAVDGGYSIAG